MTETKPSNDSHQLFHAGVQCLVQDSGRRVLLGLRARTAGAGEWSLPGGHVEFAETPIQTAIRELREETGLDGIDPAVLPSFTTYTTDVPYVHVPVMFRSIRGAPVVQQGEVFDDWAFFAVSALPEKIFAPSLLALKLVDIPPVPRDSEPAFVKVDLISLDPSTNRNRGYVLNLVRSQAEYLLYRSWGRRDQPKWQQEQQQFEKFDDALAELRRHISRRMRGGYVLVGATGDVNLQWLESLFPSEMGVRLQSRQLTERLTFDKGFRETFAHEVAQQLSLGSQW